MRVSGITVLLYATQGLNSQILLFGYFQMFLFCLCFYLRSFGRLFFQKYIFLTILTLWEFFIVLNFLIL
jgi:hypothetical protein